MGNFRPRAKNRPKLAPRGPGSRGRGEGPHGNFGGPRGVRFLGNFQFFLFFLKFRKKKSRTKFYHFFVPIFLSKKCKQFCKSVPKIGSSRGSGPGQKIPPCRVGPAFCTIFLITVSRRGDGKCQAVPWEICGKAAEILYYSSAFWSKSCGNFSLGARKSKILLLGREILELDRKMAKKCHFRGGPKIRVFGPFLTKNPRPVGSDQLFAPFS